MPGKPHKTFLVAFLVVGVAMAQSAAAQPIRVMPFGEDNTQGRDGRASYRYALWFMLQDAGFDVDFVGRVQETKEPVNEDWYPEYYTTFDRVHEGWTGTRTSAQISIADAAAEIARPHVVLLMTGIRDIYELGGGGASLAENNIPLIIENIRNHVPDVTILLAQNAPWVADHSGSDNNTEHVPTLNAAIARVAQAEHTPESPVYLVDNYTGFNTSTMFDPDNQTFPNPAGEAFIAGNFMEVLEDVLPEIDPSGSGDFRINAGLNDAWFNPDTSGQGVFFTVYPDLEMMFLAWFTYDTERPMPGATANLGEPGHRWLTAFGPYAGDVAELDVELTAGGVFDTGEPAPEQESGYGEILIEFADCNSATMTYDIFSPDLSGLIELQRIAGDNIAACEMLNSQQ